MMGEHNGAGRGKREPLTEEYFLHRYRVTKVYEMGARDRQDALRQADGYTFKDELVEKIQDRSVAYHVYLQRIENIDD
jgi:hypothetical protein